MSMTYESICEKLGFDVKSYHPEIIAEEDDSKGNPFSKLTAEEIKYGGRISKNRLLDAGLGVKGCRYPFTQDQRL